MSTHKNIDRICCVVIVLSLLLTVGTLFAPSLGVSAAVTRSYEGKLFDISKVHTIDIVMDDFDSFLESCTDEEYVQCAVVVDNESFKNVAIRAKGNTSLSNVTSYGNNRYSFKLEFDHFDSTKTYYGLDKLSLNNIIQDNTYMKDFLCYQLMGNSGVASPLCSYVNITVNGEPWGLYLAVESVEESFLSRNYGSDWGELYKPDSMDMGGGRGNGGGFDMEGWQEDNADTDASAFPPGNEKDFGGGRGKFDMESRPEDNTDTDAATFPQGNGKGFGGGRGQMPNGESPQITDDEMAQMPGGRMGSSDVSLIYTDDEYDSYSNIFSNAKTDITNSDKNRLIASIRQMNENEGIDEVVNIDAVINYFAVHNFVCNFDSYTGSMMHNYYLYEDDGRMEMIPWDYNLAFGGFQGASDATALANYPIDSPVSGGTIESRPMLSWIFSNEEYLSQYHQAMDRLISDCFESGYISELLSSTKALIAPYVESDPTKFCTYEEFEAGVDALSKFCALRAESVRGQLSGEIPATSEAQAADGAALIDATSVDVSAMGSMMGSGMGRPDEGGFGRPGEQAADADGAEQTAPPTENKTEPQNQSGQTMQPPDRTEDFGGFDPTLMPAQQGSNTQSLLIIGLCVLMLITALTVVLLYKKRV